MQVAAPALAEIMPDGHREHGVLPPAAWNVPALHGTHAAGHNGVARPAACNHSDACTSSSHRA